MRDVDSWGISDSSEAELITPLANTAPDLSCTPEEKEGRARRLFEKLDPALSPSGEPMGAAITAASPLAQVEGPRQEGEEGVTVRCPTFDPRAAAAAPPTAEPFVASPRTAEPLVPSPPVDAEKAGPPKRHPLEDLKITMLAQPISAEDRAQAGRLPFKLPKPGSELARTLQSPVHNPLKGQTAGHEDNAIRKALASLPFIGAVVGDAFVTFPRLTIQQYASLCAELAVWPTRSGEILRQYRVVNETARRALTEHWEAELAKSLKARTTFEEALAVYTAWLRSQRA